MLLIRKYLFFTLAMLAGLSTLACGDDDDGNEPGTSFDRLIGLGIRLRLPDGTTTASYIRPFASLDGVTQVQVDDQAREFIGQRRFRKLSGGLIVEHAEQPSITRLEFDPNVGFVDGPPPLSLSGLAFTRAGVSIQIGERKAYNVSFDTLQVAIYDPVDMRLLTPDPIDLSAQLKAGFVTNGISTAQFGSLLYLGIAFANLSNPLAPTVADNITVLILDTSTDTFVTAIENDGCHHANGMAQTDNGDIYVLGDNGFNAIRPTATACIVRIPAGSTDFDPDYLFQPNAALGMRETSDLQSLTGNLALTYPLYPEQINPADPTSVAFDPVRRPWVIDLQAQTAQEISGLPFTRGTTRLSLDGQPLINVSSDFESTALYSIDANAASATLVLESEGQLLSIVEFP